MLFIFSTEWEKVIKIGVVDCALDENIPLCREYEIMGYPTLKFFPSFTNSTYLGTPMKGSKKVPNIRQNMIDFVEKQFEEKKGSPHWPVLGTLQYEHNFPSFIKMTQLSIWKQIF